MNVSDKSTITTNKNYHYIGTTLLY